MNSAIERLSMLYNQAHTLTTTLQTEYKICDVDLMDMECTQFWNDDDFKSEQKRVVDRMRRLRDLIRKSKDREHNRWIDLNSYIYQEEN
jgi:hypothetical protein